LWEPIDQAERGNDRARLAIEMFCYRIRKYIGAYFAVLGSVDAIEKSKEATYAPTSQ
jgi:acetate kinase